MDTPRTPPQEQQQQQVTEGIRPQPSNLSTSSIASAATFIASPLSSSPRAGASSYLSITGVSEDYISYKGGGAEQQQQQNQSPSPQQQESSPLYPSLGSGAFPGHRPQGLGVRSNCGAAISVRQGPPPLSRGSVNPANSKAWGGTGGLECHLEVEEVEAEAEREKGHKRATIFGTLDSGGRYVLLQSFFPLRSFVELFC